MLQLSTKRGGGGSQSNAPLPPCPVLMTNLEHRPCTARRIRNTCSAQGQGWRAVAVARGAGARSEPSFADSFETASEGSKRFIRGFDWPRRVIVKQLHGFTSRAIGRHRFRKRGGRERGEVRKGVGSLDLRNLPKCSDACSPARTVGALAASLECCSRCVPTSALLLVSIVIVLLINVSSSCCETALDYTAKGSTTTCVQP